MGNGVSGRIGGLRSSVGWGTHWWQSCGNQLEVLPVQSVNLVTARPGKPPTSASPTPTHPFPATPAYNADKRRAVNLLLADGEWRKRSDRWIAEQCRVQATSWPKSGSAEISTVIRRQSTRPRMPRRPHDQHRQHRQARHLPLPATPASEPQTTVAVESLIHSRRFPRLRLAPLPAITRPPMRAGVPCLPPADAPIGLQSPPPTRPEDIRGT